MILLWILFPPLDIMVKKDDIVLAILFDYLFYIGSAIRKLTKNMGVFLEVYQYI